MDGRYNPAKHSNPLVCRECRAENAPKETEEYTKECHDCGYKFDAPVSSGETVEVEITDIHESGRGVGKTDNGFIILVSGALPPSGDNEIKKAKVEVDAVYDNHAEADGVIESTVVESLDEEDNEEDNEEDEEPSLGRREDYWG